MLERLRTTYKSLDNPEFFFVERTIDHNPYIDLLQAIQQLFQIEDDTDPNDDVSFGYVLSQGEQQWVLRLSMIGPFAVVFRITKSSAVELIGLTSQPLAPVEIQLFDLLSSKDIQLLDKPELEQHVPIQLDNAVVGDTRLYQALFTDTEVLPWNV